MKTQIKAHFLEDDHWYDTTVSLASSCPICGVSLNPDIISSAVLTNEDDEDFNKAFILNRCTNCDECFLSRHTYNSDTDVYEYESSAPQHFFKQHFSADIEHLSPNFVSIYNDSSHAESIGMTSICGMGYRKALEFLIKDFAISNNPDDLQQIASMPLAQCIDNFINDARLKSLAKASAWLGNDATHYVKKHPQYGTNELKAFINAFITFIDSDLAYNKAQALLSSK